MQDNVRESVWKFIDTDISLKKGLSRKIINAIRRYSLDVKKSDEKNSIHDVLKQARVAIRTKMSSLLLKRTDLVKTKLGRPDKLMDFQGHDIIRVLEGSQALTIVIDQKNFEK